MHICTANGDRVQVIIKRQRRRHCPGLYQQDYDHSSTRRKFRAKASHADGARAVVTYGIFKSIRQDRVASQPGRETNFQWSFK